MGIGGMALYTDNMELSLSCVLRLFEDFILKSLLESWHDCGTSCQHNVIVKVDSKITVALVNRFAGHFVDTCHFSTIHLRQA